MRTFSKGRLIILIGINATIFIAALLYIPLLFGSQNEYALEQLTELRSKLGYENPRPISNPSEIIYNWQTMIDLAVQLQGRTNLEVQLLNRERVLRQELQAYARAAKEFPELEPLVYLPREEAIAGATVDSPTTKAAIIHILKRHTWTKLQIYNTKSETALRYEYSIERELHSLTLEKKLAQMIVFGVNGTTLTQSEKDLLQRWQPGGVVIQTNNVSENVGNLTNQIQASNPNILLFTMIDQEGGSVERIWWEDAPGPRELVNLPEEKICQVFNNRAKLLQSLGLNWNLGIVADYTNDRSSFIYTRTYGDSPDQIERVIESASRCEEGVISTLKHFPGHGEVAGDTHAEILHVPTAESVWLENTVKPFQAGVGSGADSVMYGHLILNWLDPENPASLSLKAHQYFRENDVAPDDLLLITDDMHMLTAGGLEWKDALRRALAADNDVLLYSWVDDKREELMQELSRLVQSGEITAEGVDPHLKRILARKNELVRQLPVYVPGELLY